MAIEEEESRLQSPYNEEYDAESGSLLKDINVPEKPYTAYMEKRKKRKDRGRASNFQSMTIKDPSDIMNEYLQDRDEKSKE
jgi:hypothetical protein